MSLHSTPKHSQLFTLRVWPEEMLEGRSEWRGKLQHVLDGETLYFHDWTSMIAHLQRMLETYGAGPAPGPDFPKSVSAAAQESIPTPVSSEAGTAVD